MSNLFEYTEYRAFLRSLIEAPINSYSQVNLSKAVECQAAYFSQVLKERAELTEDHGIKLCRFLELSSIETQYFLIILRQSRAGSKVLSDYLEEERKKILRLYDEIVGRVPAAKDDLLNEMNTYYCSSWIPSVIHLATACKNLQTIEQIVARFGLKVEVVNEHLKKLQKYALVKFEKGRWMFQGQSIHFTKNSPLDHSFQISRRLLAMNSLSSKGNDDLHYSVIFASDLKTIKKLRSIFLKAIEEVHLEAEPSPSEEVFSIALDLFRV